MKLLRNYLFQALLFVVAVVSMQSCSCNKRETIEEKLDYVMSDDVAVVMSGDIARLFAAMDLTVTDGRIALPDYMTQFMNGQLSGRERSELEDALGSLKGMNFTNAVAGVKIDSDGASGLLVFSVEDEDDFVESMCDLNSSFDKESVSGYTAVGTESGQILVKDHLGFVAFGITGPLSGDDAADMIESWVEAAEKTPLASWRKTYLIEPRVFTMLYDLSALAENIPASVKAQFNQQMAKMGMGDFDVFTKSFAITADLEGSSLKLNFSVLNSDGSEMTNPGAGKFNVDLFKYTTTGDVIAVGGCMSEKGNEIWLKSLQETQGEMELIRRLYGSGISSYLDAMQKVAPIVTEYVSDGGFLVAAGLGKNVSASDLMNNPSSPANYHVVAAAALRPEKAAEGFEFVCNNLASIPGVEVSEAGAAKVFTITVQTEYNYSTDSYETVKVPVYVELDGNNLVVSNVAKTVNEGNNFDTSLFSGCSVAAQLKLDKDFTVLSMLNLPCGVDVKLSIKDCDLAITASLTGTDKKFVPAVFDIINGRF